MSSRERARLGCSVIPVMSALTKLKPASTTRRYAFFNRSMESASRQRGSVGGNICPMSPRPAAPRMASVRACATASASECPTSPRGWGISTPPRMSRRPSASVKRCESYPIPTRTSGLENTDREESGVLGVVDPDAGHRYAAGQLRGGEQRIEPVQRPARERHADHREIGDRGGEPWECRREPRPGDHHPEALLAGAFHEVRGVIGLPVGGGHMELVRNARLAQDLEGGLDTRLVALGADDYQHVGHAQAASSITL